MQENGHYNEVKELSYTPLRTQLNKLSVLGVLALIILAWIFQSLQMAPIDSLYWLCMSVLCWGITIVGARRLLDQNRPSEKAPLWSTIGIANKVTLLRGWCISSVGGFLSIDAPEGALLLFPGTLYAVAVILDRVDGFAARRSDQVSIMGTELDTFLDAFGLVVSPILAVQYGQLHWTYLMVSVAYYVYSGLIALRKRYGLSVHTPPKRIEARASAGFQMGFVAAILFPWFDVHATQLIGIIFMIHVLWGFLIDWMGVIDYRDGNGVSAYERWKRYKQKYRSIIQVSTRLLFSGMTYILMIHSFSISLYSFGVLACTLMILLGVGARFAGVIALLLMASDPPQVNIFADLSYLSASIVALLGAGPISIWTWDEEWVHRYDGA